MGRWHYPKWRRVTMQAVLCLTLGGSIALAQWVVHDRQTNGGSRLSALQEFGAIEVRLPAGWKLQSQSPAQLEAEESPSGENAGRILLILQEHQLLVVSPELVYRLANFHTEPIKIGPYEGVLVSLHHREDTEMAPGAGPIHYQLLAQCVSSKGLAISIQLDCPVPVTQDDRELIRDIAKAIVVPGKL